MAVPDGSQAHLLWISSRDIALFDDLVTRNAPPIPEEGEGNQKAAIAAY
jgi:hypothetical protein